MRILDNADADGGGKEDAEDTERKDNKRAGDAGKPTADRVDAKSGDNANDTDDGAADAEAEVTFAHLFTCIDASGGTIAQFDVARARQYLQKGLKLRACLEDIGSNVPLLVCIDIYRHLGDRLDASLDEAVASGLQETARALATRVNNLRQRARRPVRTLAGRLTRLRKLVETMNVNVEKAVERLRAPSSPGCEFRSLLLGAKPRRDEQAELGAELMQRLVRAGASLTAAAALLKDFEPSHGPKEWLGDATVEEKVGAGVEAANEAFEAIKLLAELERDTAAARRVNDNGAGEAKAGGKEEEDNGSDDGAGAGEGAGAGDGDGGKDADAEDAAVAVDELPSTVAIPCSLEQLEGVLSYLYTGTVPFRTVAYLTMLGDAAVSLGLVHMANTCMAAARHIASGKPLRVSAFGDGKRFQLGKPLELARDLAAIPHMPLLSRTFSDTTFAGADGVVHGHAALIFFRCTALENVLPPAEQGVGGGDGKVDVSGYSVAALRRFLSYLYSGSIGNSGEVTHEVVELLSLADKYGLPRLTNVCEAQIDECMSEQNVIELFGIAERYDARQLAWLCHYFVVTHFATVSKRQEYKDLPRSHPLRSVDPASVISRAPSMRKRGKQDGGGCVVQ